MNADEVAVLRLLLEGSPLESAVDDFAAALGTAPQPAGGLLLVGTPADEPWHFAAHLGDEARWAGRPELEPTLVRWSVPDGAPAHLAVPLTRIEAARRGETLLVVSGDGTPAPLLERLSDARRSGALVLAMETGDAELRGIAHEALTLPRRDDTVPYLDLAQHVVSAAAPTAVARARSLRERLGAWLDRVQGVPHAPEGRPHR